MKLTRFRVYVLILVWIIVYGGMHIPRMYFPDEINATYTFGFMMGAFVVIGGYLVALREKRESDTP